MKGTRHSEERIIAILKQGEAGLGTSELCRGKVLRPQSRMYGSVAFPAEADEILFGILRLATSPVNVMDLKTGDRPAALRAMISCEEGIV